MFNDDSISGGPSRRETVNLGSSNVLGNSSVSVNEYNGASKAMT